MPAFSRTLHPFRPQAALAARRFRGPALVFLAAWMLTSCAFLRRHPRPAAATDSSPRAATAALSPAPAAAIRHTSAEHRVGTVRVIGTAQRFVLIELPLNAYATLPDGQLLRCAADPSPDSPATATLRVARERRRPFVVADVVSGEPRIGDAVFVASAPPSAATGSMVLPTSTSGVLPILLPGGTPAPTHP